VVATQITVIIREKPDIQDAVGIFASVTDVSGFWFAHFRGRLRPGCGAAFARDECHELQFFTNSQRQIQWWGRHASKVARMRADGQAQRSNPLAPKEKSGWLRRFRSARRFYDIAHSWILTIAASLCALAKPDLGRFQRPSDLRQTFVLRTDVDKTMPRSIDIGD